MNLDFGMFILIFCGVVLCGLYFWSAIKDQARRLTRVKHDIEQFREAQSKQQRLPLHAAPRQRRPPAGERQSIVSARAKETCL
jgi:hypothetical protein